MKYSVILKERQTYISMYLFWKVDHHHNSGYQRSRKKETLWHWRPAFGRLLKNWQITLLNNCSSTLDKWRAMRKIIMGFFSLDFFLVFSQEKCVSAPSEIETRHRCVELALTRKLHYVRCRIHPGNAGRITSGWHLIASIFLTKVADLLPVVVPWQHC